MTPLDAPTREDALRFSRVAEPQFPAVRMLASAGNVELTLGSVASIEAFLTPMTAEENLSRRMTGFINYVDFKSLEQWVRETIGDSDLADSLLAVVDRGDVFGVMLPDVKQLLTERLSQYKAALELDPGEEAPSDHV